MRYAILFILVFPSMAFAQISPALPPPSNGWVRLNDEQWGLWQNGVQIGNLRGGQFYLKTSSTSWASQPSEPPVPLPEVELGKRRKKCGCSTGCRCKADKCGCSAANRCHKGCCCHKAADDPDPSASADAAVPADKNFGLDLDKLGEEPPNHSVVSGRTVSKEELLQAIEGNQAAGEGKQPVPDDAKLLCLTAIGSPADCKEVLDDLKTSPLLEPWRKRLKIKSYSPDHWAVRDVGFKTDGCPTIYVQRADGEVLHRQDDYRGPKALSEALRKLDPQYDPHKDPDLNRSGFSDNSGAIIWGVLVLLVLTGVGFFFVVCLLFFLFLVTRLLNRSPSS